MYNGPLKWWVSPQCTVISTGKSRFKDFSKETLPIGLFFSVYILVFDFLHFVVFQVEDIQCGKKHTWIKIHFIPHIEICLYVPVCEKRIEKNVSN